MRGCERQKRGAKGIEQTDLTADCVSLDQLRDGERGRLCAIPATHPLRERLTDLGWTPGTHICCLRRSPLGDPVAYAVRGGVFALRRADGRDISVKQQE